MRTSAAQGSAPLARAGASFAVRLRAPVSPVSPFELIALRQDSGDCQVQLGYQVSNDQKNWYSGAAAAAEGTFATLGSEVTAEGTTYGSTFTTISLSEKKMWMRFGVGVPNGSAGKPETCNVTVRLDMKR